MRSRNHVRIAFTDPADNDSDYILTERRWPPTPAGMTAAATACDEYNTSPDVTKNYLAVAVLVTPAEDDRAVKALLRLVSAVGYDTEKPTPETKRDLEAAVGAAVLLLQSLQML